MLPTPKSRERFRFGDFDLDVSAYELRFQGRPVQIERRPMDLLVLLIERRGHLVSRADIIERLWGQDVFVEVDGGRAEIFVRDRGKGFDTDGVPEDRLGLRHSVMGRMERHGGRATVRSNPETGTEVRLEMDR